MRAVRVAAPGGPEVLVPVAPDDPRPGPGEVLVDVATTGTVPLVP